MLILILINAQCLQNVVFSFEKGLSGQNHSLSDEKLSDRKIPPGKFPIPQCYKFYKVFLKNATF